MKLLITSLALAATALAQRVAITYPNAGQNIPAGSSINVQVAEGVRSLALSVLVGNNSLTHIFYFSSNFRALLRSA